MKKKNNLFSSMVLINIENSFYAIKPLSLKSTIY